MRKKKWIPFNPFVPYDRIGLEQYLEKQARKGWMLECADSGLTFRRIEPQAIHFAVCYLPGFEEYFPLLTPKQQEFLALCGHDGWELVTNTPATLILCNRNPDPPPIETDPVLEVEMIGEATKRSHWAKRYCGAVFVGVFAVLRGLQLMRNDLVGLQDLHALAIALFGALLCLIIYGLQWGGFLLWRRKARQVAEKEDRLHPVSMGWDFEPLAVVFLIVVLWMCSNYEQKLPAFLIGAVFGAELFFLPHIKAAMERRMVSQKKQTLILASVILVINTGLMGLSIYLETSNPVPLPERYICEHPDWDPPYTHYVYREEIPLRIEDLTGDAYAEDQYDARWSMERSAFLVQYEATHTSCGFGRHIKYTIVDTYAPSRYDRYLTDLLDRQPYVLIQENYTGAQAIYQVYDDDRPLLGWMFCFEKRIVMLETDWALTEEQLQKVAEILQNCPLPNT